MFVCLSSQRMQTSGKMKLYFLLLNFPHALHWDIAGIHSSYGLTNPTEWTDQPSKHRNTAIKHNQPDHSSGDVGHVQSSTIWTLELCAQIPPPAWKCVYIFSWFVINHADRDLAMGWTPILKILSNILNEYTNSTEVNSKLKQIWQPNQLNV
jgi:hypothetical protein